MQGRLASVLYWLTQLSMVLHISPFLSLGELQKGRGWRLDTPWVTLLTTWRNSLALLMQKRTGSQWRAPCLLVDWWEPSRENHHLRYHVTHIVLWGHIYS